MDHRPFLFCPFFLDGKYVSAILFESLPARPNPMFYLPEPRSDHWCTLTQCASFLLSLACLLTAAHVFNACPGEHRSFGLLVDVAAAATDVAVAAVDTVPAIGVAPAVSSLL